jgi:2-polyprenyl-3-methyl-5-hydroxy-6-metoxy-1,4-benzoquinol methylase
MQTSSFRDPAGFVLARDQRVFRVVRQGEAEELFRFMETGPGQELVGGGGLIGSRYAAGPDRDRVLGEVASRIGSWESPPTVLEHDSIWFPSYPYEWPSAMLREAGRLTLDIASKLIGEGKGLKDATPYNILFRGAEAVFIDAMSIERREPLDPIWRPMAQFLQTFLYPLTLEKATSAPSGETMFGRREGIGADEVYARLGRLQRLANLRWVSIPHWLNSRKSSAATYRPQMSGDADTARAVLRSTFRSLRSAIDSTESATASRTTWNDYSIHCHYDGQSRAQKHAFVSDALSRFENGRVLDLGANDGEYSLASARAGHDTVACDLDSACMNALWRRAKAENLSILPLAMNIAHPSPALGWANQETRPFLRRVRDGRFDCVLMLALLHHLTVTERVPLPLVIDLAADLTDGLVVLEWVSPEDPFYRQLIRGRENLHGGDTREAFEQACQRRFKILRREQLMEGRRWIYLLSTNGAA